MIKRILDNVTAVPILCCGFLLYLLLTQPCVAHDTKHPEFDESPDVAKDNQGI